MQVTNVTVGYDRKRQPAQYESAGAKVEFACVLSATVGDTEDHVAVATKMLGEAKTIVLTELGIVKAGTSASAAVLAEASKPAETAKPAAPAPTQTPAAPKTLTPAQQKKADEKAAKEKEAADKAAAASAPQIRTNPENRVDPNDDIPGEGAPTPIAPAEPNDDIPGEETAKPATPAAGTALTITQQEIHGFIAASLKEKKLDHGTVKGVSAKFGVARIADLKPEQYAAYKAELDSEIKRLATKPNDDIGDL